MWTAEAVLACALTLLGRSVSSFPPIEFVARPPADVSASAEAYVRVNDTRIFLVTTSRHFQSLQLARDRCGDVWAARKLASVLIHEEAHLKQGADEKEAYAAQLTTLTALGSGMGTPPYMEVVRAMRQTLAQPKRKPERIIVIGLSRERCVGSSASLKARPRPIEAGLKTRGHVRRTARRRRRVRTAAVVRAR